MGLTRCYKTKVFFTFIAINGCVRKFHRFIPFISAAIILRHRKYVTPVSVIASSEQEKILIKNCIIWTDSPTASVGVISSARSIWPTDSFQSHHPQFPQKEKVFFCCRVRKYFIFLLTPKYNQTNKCTFNQGLKCQNFRPQKAPNKNATFLRHGIVTTKLPLYTGTENCFCWSLIHYLRNFCNLLWKLNPNNMRRTSALITGVFIGICKKIKT